MRFKVQVFLTPRYEIKKCKNTQTFYQKLQGVENIEFRLCHDMHMKIIHIDSIWLYFGSANLTGAGLGSRTRKGCNNFEIGTITIEQSVIFQLEDLLLKVWEGEHCKNCYQKNKGYCKGID